LVLFSNNATDTYSDSPISHYLPEFNVEKDPDITRSATLIDILSHRTGANDESTLFVGPNGMPWSNSRKNMFTTARSLEAVPGKFRKVWAYNSVLYALVTCIIEDISGMKFGDFLHQRLFQPLGMNSTSLMGNRGSQPEPDMSYSKAYAAVSSGDIIERSSTIGAYQFPCDASMGVQSSGADLGKWSRAIMNAYRQVYTKVESEETGPYSPLREMATILTPWSDLPSNAGGHPSYCLGWFMMCGQYIYDDIFDMEAATGSFNDLEWPCTLPVLCGSEPTRIIVYHSGAGHGSASSLHMYPVEQDAVVVLGNSSDSGDAVDAVAKLLNAVLCGHNLSETALLKNTQWFAAMELGRWKAIRDDLLEQQKKQCQRRLVDVHAIIGCYEHRLGSRSLRIIIQQDASGANRAMEGIGPCIGAIVKFGTMTEFGLPLQDFCENTGCFLPAEEGFQSLGMSYMIHWAQYLIHLQCSHDSGAITGLWWQHEPEKDGILFTKLCDTQVRHESR
jgi:CubicO group peptidase (beta-lactamase class C family)